MDNMIAHDLGLVSMASEARSRSHAGDMIDRGLILLRHLNEAGFDVIKKDKSKIIDSGPEFLPGRRGLSPLKGER
jgi:hypothetical protein